jgi:ketol-acid reductoisomerase
MQQPPHDEPGSRRSGDLGADYMGQGWSSQGEATPTEPQAGPESSEGFLETCVSVITNPVATLRRLTREHEIEQVGERLRSMMPWITAKRLVDTAKN